MNNVPDMQPLPFSVCQVFGSRVTNVPDLQPLPLPVCQVISFKPDKPSSRVTNVRAKL